MKKKLFVLFFLLSMLCCFAAEIEITSVTVSSTLASQSNLYEANHLIDETEKSWVEGEDGSGIGTVITINFSKTEKIQTFYIKNGYGDFKHYYANNRVKTLQCGFQKRGAAFINLEDKPGFQKVEFDIPVETNKLVLTIKDVYKGTKYDDTAIAEISFDSWEDLPHNSMNRSIIAYRIDDIYECYEKKDSLITNRVNTSMFSLPRQDSRHGEDWFLYSCQHSIIPLTNGGMYFLSSLTSNYMGQPSSSAYAEYYVLFSKLDGEKIIPCQNEFISLGSEEDIKELELELEKNTLTNKQKVFIEKYIKMVNDLEESKITNFPFLCTLFTVRVDNTSEIELYANEYVEFSWWKMKCLYPGYFFNIKYCAPSEIISSVSLP